MVSHTSEIVVRKLPRASNRRDEETIGGRSMVSEPRRDRRRQKSISSNKGHSRKPPMRSNALRRAKMPWSPKNQPSNRERASPIRQVRRKTGDAPWKRLANPPPTTLGKSRV